MGLILTFFTVHSQRSAFNTEALMCAGHKTTEVQTAGQSGIVCQCDAALGQTPDLTHLNLSASLLPALIGQLAHG